MGYSRRSFLRLGTSAGATLATSAALGTSVASSGAAGQSSPGQLELTFAVSGYDPVKALIDGRVQIAGVHRTVPARQDQ